MTARPRRPTVHAAIGSIAPSWVGHRIGKGEDDPHDGEQPQRAGQGPPVAAALVGRLWGSSTRTSHMPGPSLAVGSPEERPLAGGDKWLRRTRNGRCRGRRKKVPRNRCSISDEVDEPFFGPRQRPFRVHPDQAAKIDRSASGCRVPRRGARSARPMPRTLTTATTITTLLPFFLLLGRAGERVGTAGPWLRRAGVAGYPCAPVVGGRGRPRSGRPQVPLEGVQKVVTTSSMVCRDGAGKPAYWLFLRPALRRLCRSTLARSPSWSSFAAVP
jgi:hypothetical protein